MGNNESSTSINLTLALQDYTLITTSDDKRFGEISLYQHKIKPELIWVKEVSIETEQAFRKMETYLKNQSHKNPLFLTDTATFVGVESNVCGACSSNRKLAVFMEYFERDLEGELTRRAEDYDFFPEPEIWYILEEVIKAEKHMLDINSIHGDIRACSIFITEDGVAKFADTYLLDFRRKAYAKTLLNVARCPLPPELLQPLQKNLSNPKHNYQKTEAWMIGVLLLCMGTLVPEDTIYDWKNFCIKESEYNQLLSEIKGRYSELFAELVCKCLSFDEEKRPSLSEILGYLQRRKVDN